MPDLPGVAEADVWNSETILRLERLPESLLILGGGYVGVEFASMFAVFGSRVTLLQGGDQLLPREDPDVAAQPARLLIDQGVDVRLESRATAVHRGSDRGDVVVALGDGTEVRAQELLVATGRTPVTADLGLAAAGVDLTERDYVAVDDHLRTSAEHVWAAGDVAGSPQFTHASWHDFRVLRANLTGGDAVTTGRLVPYAVFTTPELARVGFTEKEARTQGYRVKIARIDVAAIPRAKTLHDTTGTWKASGRRRDRSDPRRGPARRRVRRRARGREMAMLGNLPYQHVRDAVIAHPTMAEGLNLLFDTLGDGQSRATGPVRDGALSR